MPAIHKACKNNDSDEVLRLLTQNISLRDQTESKNGFTPLMVCVTGSGDGSVECMKVLLEFGADVNGTDYRSRTPLHLAAHWGRVEMILLLVEHGADLNKVDKDSTAPIHVAANRNSEGCLRVLIDCGADVGKRNDMGRTVAHWAAETNRSDIELLTDYVGVADDSGVTPLHLAADKGNEVCLDTIINAGADLNCKTSFGRTPLFMAARKGHTRVVRKLMNGGADVSVVDRSGTTVAHKAAAFEEEHGARLLLQDLVEKGADIRAVDKLGTTIVAVASAKGNYRNVVYAVEQGADVNAPSSTGQTPAHWAATMGHTRLLSFLIESGANINAADRDGRTPAHAAALSGKADVLEVLAKSGANMHQGDSHGRTPIHCACESWSKACIALLVKNCLASMRVKDNLGRAACEWTSEAAVDLLHYHTTYNAPRMAVLMIANRMNKATCEDEYSAQLGSFSSLNYDVMEMIAGFMSAAHCTRPASPEELEQPAEPEMPIVRHGPVASLEWYLDEDEIREMKEEQAARSAARAL